MKKSMKSDILFWSVGQYVDLAVDKISHLSSMAASFPFVVVSVDPQWTCLALKSPQMMNLYHSLFRKSKYFLFLRACFGEQ